MRTVVLSLTLRLFVMKEDLYSRFLQEQFYVTTDICTCACTVVVQLAEQ